MSRRELALWVVVFVLVLGGVFRYGPGVMAADERKWRADTEARMRSQLRDHHNLVPEHVACEDWHYTPHEVPAVCVVRVRAGDTRYFACSYGGLCTPIASP